MDRDRLGKAVTELTDEQVFGKQAEMSDAQVFGDPMPDALQTSVPEAFLDRVRAGQALARITQAAAKGAGEGVGQGTPTGFEDDTLNHLIGMGVFHDPTSGRGGPIQMMNEAVMIPAAKLWETVTRATSAGVHGAGGAMEQVVNEFGGSEGTANRAKNEVINFANWAMIEGGMGHFSRPAVTPEGVADQAVGSLPTPQDFSNAAEVLTQPPKPGDIRFYHGTTYEDASGFTGSTFVTPHYDYAKNYRGSNNNVLYTDFSKEEAINRGLYDEINGYPRHGPIDDGASLLKPMVAEQNLRRMWQEDGIHPAEAVHDAQSDAFLKNEITAQRQEIKLDPETERVLTETGGKPGDLSAAITPPEEIPLDRQPASPPGSLIAAAQNAAEKLFDVGHDIQMKLTPMARGSVDSMATVKDYMNSMRRNDWDVARIDTDLMKRFTPEQRTRMWNAMDEESLSLRLGEPESAREHQGLATLTPEERAAVVELDTRQQLAWLRARDLGMVEGEGIAMHAPRMVVNAKGADREGAMSLTAMGYDLRTRTPGMRQRKYMEVEQTEAAAKAKYGEKATVARDIRTVNLGTKQLEDAIAGRTLIDNIKDVGKRTGDETVAEGFKPGDGWFTIDHPAFKKAQAVGTDEAGNTIWKQIPLYVRGDFEGPLRSAMWGKSGETYKAMMALKGKTMGLIMNSPAIHNLVEFGRAFPAMPTRIVKAYFDGNRAKNDIGVMHEAINSGLVPIGRRFFNQDINALMETPDLTPGRSWTAKIAAAVPGLFDEAAGTAVKQAIDKAGDFWHNTLLWDRVADLQMGLYTNFRGDMIAKGMDQQTASRVAAHLANRYAGALPKEAMSEAATKISNFAFFSRSFTFGNLGVMKDMLTGLPKDVLAQIERDAGFKAGSIDQAGELNSPVEQAVTTAKSMARRKAMMTIGLDIALMYAGNSVLQSAFNVMLGQGGWTQESHEYMRRFRDLMNEGSVHPLSLLNPFHVLGSLSATNENEPNRKDRVLVGYAKDGTAIYGRNPVGKIGEEFTNYFGSPLDMIRKKEGTMLRPMMQILSNDAGFGRKIYDPTADTPAKYAGNIAAIVEHLIGSQLPAGQLGAAHDLITGEGDKKVNLLQAFGPVAGFTFSKGAPGGPQVGEMYAAKDRHEFEVNQAMPDIRRQIKRGDTEGAMNRMTELDIPVSLQRWYLKTTLNPALRMSPRAVKDFYLHATAEERARFDRAQQPPQSP